jgi:hypothetical protein
MSKLSDRARAIAAAARAKEANVSPGPERDYVMREWYVVQQPDGAIELYLCPPQNLEWVQALYPDCKVEIRL